MNAPTDARVALITGATSGIGRALAEQLAGAGLTVALVAREAERGEAAAKAISASTGNDRVEVCVGDLSKMASVRDLASLVREAHPALDILVHCAAVYTSHRSITTDGFETMMATNVLGPFLLTSQLVDPLRSASAARILVLAAPSTVQLDFDDLQSEGRFRSLHAFGATKAADLLFTFELARRLEGTTVTANAVHPGLARTNLMRQAPAPLRWVTRLVSAPSSQAAGAIAPLAVASAYAGVTGRFFHDGREIDAPAYTRDPEVARRLWDVCARLTKVAQDAAVT